MSRYENLTKQCTDLAETYFSDKHACQNLAYIITKEYREFLEVPPNLIYNYWLLGPGEENPNTRVKPTPHTPIAKGDDQYWYFAIGITFENPSSKTFGRQTLHIGIKPTSEGFELFYKKKFRVHEAKQAELYEFFTYLYSETEAQLQAYPSDPHGIKFEERT